VGTWGTGNFEDDDALDYLATEVADPLVAKMQSVFSDPSSAEPDEPSFREIIAAVEILCVLCERLNAVPPPPDTVAACHREYLRIWDAYEDPSLAEAEYLRHRRSVIASTFERLESLARSWHRREA
jgi:hypothetical protein